VVYLLPLRHVLLLLTVLLAAPAQRAPEELGLSGYVLAPDGAPVTGGTAVVESRTPFPSVRAAAAIDRTGRFRLVPESAGVQTVVVRVPGLAPYRVSVAVPPSRTLKLPVIRLDPATHFRVRFVSAAGEPLASPQLRRQSLDLEGLPLADPPEAKVADQIDGDGTLTIGPLPRGITTMALDTPLFAQTRLPDLYVTGAETLLDGGTVVVQPGAVLHVDVVDAAGVPVPKHDVYIEDALPLSPLVWRPVRTDKQGRATFDRLGAGRYRVRAQTLERCGGRPLSIARVVSVSGSGTLRTRLVVSGTATFRFTSPLGPVRGVGVTASPENNASPPPAWLRGRSDAPFGPRPFSPLSIGTACGGATDGDGRLTLSNFPPGPTRVEVRLLNSTYVRRVSVPEDQREIHVVVPDGFLPLRVINAVKNTPVGGASLTWIGGGGRVEARASANGEALLEGVGTTEGTLAITASGYQPGEAKLSEPPAMQVEVALTPEPPTALEPRVVTMSGEPLPNAVVELSSANPYELARVAVTDTKGVVRFTDVPSGELRLTASADGFASAALRVAEENRSGIVFTLSRGYRVIADVELPANAGPHFVQVMTERGLSMDGFLDLASDRRIDPPGRLALGPMPPGAYRVELHGPRESLRQQIQIIDRDIYAIFR
jgi:hypothetical protein